jgi:hypothetical protein
MADIAELRQNWVDAEQAWEDAYADAIIKHRGEGLDEVVRALAFKATKDLRDKFDEAATAYNTVIDAQNSVIVEAHRQQLERNNKYAKWLNDLKEKVSDEQNAEEG